MRLIAQHRLPIVKFRVHLTIQQPHQLIRWTNKQTIYIDRKCCARRKFRRRKSVQRPKFHSTIKSRYIYIFQRFCSVASKCCSQLVYYENNMYLHTSKTITKLTSSFETTWCSITFGMCLKQPRKRNRLNMNFSSNEIEHFPIIALLYAVQQCRLKVFDSK